MLYTRQCEQINWVESESHASRIVSSRKIYDTLERSALKIHRRVFVSCSRAKGCNFCGLLTFCSETFVEKLSPLNALRNYGDRWGKLRRVRKHESHPEASLRWLARKIFFWPIRSRQFKRFWNWFGKSKCPGARLDLTVNFHHEHFIDPANCPWVSEDEHRPAPRDNDYARTGLRSHARCHNTQWSHNQLRLTTTPGSTTPTLFE